MARALRLTSPLTGRAIEVPQSLEDVDALIDLREQITELSILGQHEITLDCRKLVSLPTPALGWLVQLAGSLAERGGRLVLAHTRAQVRMQIRTFVRGAPGLDVRA